MTVVILEPNVSTAMLISAQNAREDLRLLLMENVLKSMTVATSLIVMIAMLIDAWVAREDLSFQTEANVFHMTAVIMATNVLTVTQTNVLPAEEDGGNGQKCLEACEGTNTWSHGIAFGNQAPWTYRGGDIVKWNGKKYKANWGGQETPGARTCLDEGACRNAGIQWVPVGDC